MKFSIITIVSALWALAAVPMAAQQATSAPVVSAPAVSSPAVPALEKVRTIPTKEERNETSVLYTVPAEELNAIAPEFVQKRTELLPSPHARMPHMTQQKIVHSVDYSAMMPLLIKAMQEQQAEIERLRNEISSLRAQARK
ncbi:MAG: hypothetical protein H9535_18940 [Ignavibacteria bacterium]|nr:hypothetical protein [Ignavibacteria bacterium]MBL7991401.1 hypothetical protein [Candidatus Kapabacteria bacterium]